MKCEASIEFGDDYGDNSTTFHCQLEKGHGSWHKETGDLSCDPERTQLFTVIWEDEKPKETEKRGWLKYIEEVENEGSA